MGGWSPSEVTIFTEGLKKLAILQRGKPAPACGREKAIELKPDHVAVMLPLTGETFPWLPGCTRLLALQEKSVDELWELWCNFSEQALGLAVGSRGRLRFTQRQQAAPALVEEALAAAKQHALVAQLKRQVLASGPCTIEPATQQLNSLDAWCQNTSTNHDGWNQYVKDMWRTMPKKIYTWIRGHDWEGFAYTPDDTSHVELSAWSKLWRPGCSDLQRRPAAKSKSWSSVHTLQNVIQHCPTGKPRGADRLGMTELKLMPKQAVSDLTAFLNFLVATASWPTTKREMLLWSAACRSDVLAWRQLCKDHGETPVGQGALDELFDLAYITEERSAAGQHQAGVFLDCSKRYERAPVRKLEEFALESRYPCYALNVALNMYSGNRRVLVQGAVSEGVQAMCGLPPGCGYAFLIRSLRCAGRQIEVRKRVLASLTLVKMRVNALKTVVLCKGFCDQTQAGSLARWCKSQLVIWELTRSGLRGAILCSKSA
eukprot:367147-Amphidinium_carterae.1